MSMNSRIALTLAIAEAQHGALQRHALLQSANSPLRERQTNIYYDTRRLALRKEQIVVQLREQRSSWIQSVERQAPAEFGLIQRRVWSTPYRNQFDFSTVTDAELRDWLERDKICGNLIPVFETSLLRASWQLTLDEGVSIEVILNRGWLAANGRRAPISELSLVLLSGKEVDLFSFAEKLASRVGLSPLLESRSERGYKLFLNAKAEASPARRVTLDESTSPVNAFRALALSCLTHMHLNHPGAIGSDDPEYIHQMRVAIRRLRAAIRLFKPVLPVDFVDQVVPRMRELINTLGRARDLDVLMAEIVAPVTAALPSEPCLAEMSSVLTERTYRARVDVVQALSTVGYGQHLLLIGRLLQEQSFAQNSADDEPLQRIQSVREFAERRLQRMLKKTFVLASNAQIGNPNSLHQLRLGIKHLRYGMEFFGSLMPGKSPRVMIKKLANLQGELGQLNDLANAGNILMACAVGNQNLRQAVSVIAQWHGARHEELLTTVSGRLKEIKKLRLKDYLAD